MNSLFSLLILLSLLGSLSAQTQVADTRFSHDRGFYGEAFSLEITTSTPGAAIFFTTNGSLPDPVNGAIYMEPIPISGTTVIRAIATAPGSISTNIDTHTYLFPTDIISQPANIPRYPNPSYGTGGGGPTVRMDYEMDPRVTTDPAYSEDILKAFSEIPSLAISVSPNRIFGENNFYDGEDEEAQVALEVLYPNDPSDNEKVEAGIESHSHERLKRSLRLNFRSEYGDAKWQTRLFRKAPFNPNNRTTPDEVDRVILRAGNNRAWTRTFSREKTTFALDEFARLTQQAMGGDGMRGAFAHLFINGIYWGLYNPVVRADTFYTSETYGGEEGDWFAVNHGGDLSGNDDRYDYLRGALKNKDMSDAENYEELTEHLDIDNFIDYLLVHWYTNTGDWPQNNWYGGLRTSSSPEGPTPMKFFAWDGEWSWDLPHASIRNVAPDPDDTWVHPDFRANDGKNKGRVIADLFNSAKDNPLFLRRLADRAYLHLSQNGALADASSLARFSGLTDYLENAVVAESARWGDALDTNGNGSPFFTRDDEWETEVSDIEGYIEGRAPKLIAALRGEGYYPDVDPPLLSQHGGEIAAEFLLSLNLAGDGEIFYTLDGSDPADGGTLYTGSFALDETTRVLARTRNDEEWSAAADAVFIVPTDLLILVSEIHYHPTTSLENHTGDNDFEYLELHNLEDEAIDLSGYSFTSGITFTFPEDTVLLPGETGVVVGDRSCFEELHGTEVNVLGDYAGKLSNGGERLVLTSPLGQSLIDFRYDDKWYPHSDGGDYSLELVDYHVTAIDQMAWNTPAAWMDSGVPDGTPGVLSPASLSLSDWLLSHDLAADVEGRDLDRDGILDIFEYVFGTHPLRADQSSIELGETEICYTLRLDRSDVTVTPELSATMKEMEWDAATTNSERESGFEKYTVVWPDAERQFFRLKVAR